MEKYLTLLREQSMKVTPQRLEIMKYLDKYRTHPDADTIYTDLKKNNPSLSRTTVYNTLEILKEHRIIQELTISRTELRYDFMEGDHHHFLCRKCRNILNIDVGCPFLEKMLNGDHKIEEVHGYFKGVCKYCL